MYSIRTYEAIYVYKNNSKIIEILQDTKTDEKGISEIPNGKNACAENIAAEKKENENYKTNKIENMLVLLAQLLPS